ncbi:MAG TPA: vanadium-dependent haloperoxidase [Blastocatellia bacterium]|nr:vanadium-dependent haloperoxidase [Blastocatellia bacterium]
MSSTEIKHENATSSPSSSSRRNFLGIAAATVVAGVAGSASITTGATEMAQAQELELQSAPGTPTEHKRQKEAYRIRVEAARRERELPPANHPTNGDEQRYPDKIASYSKGLPHNRLGEVDRAAYASLIRAVTTGDPADFENIVTASDDPTAFGKLTNPQAGLAFEMVSADSHALVQKPPPAFSSAEEAAETAENYWMALTRDIPFVEYDANRLVNRAAADLSRFSDFRGPKSGGRVTTSTLFRGLTPGDLIGPYISQFLWLDTPFGAVRVDRRMRTTAPGVDYMTAYDDWLAVQNGATSGENQYDPIHRYIRNGRDLGEWVHIDVLFQAYFNAMLILFSLGARLDEGNPYNASRTQIGFGTLGAPYIASILCAVARPALKAVWYQKWFVHRRLRPEVFAGRVHNLVTRATNYPIHPEILNSQALNEVFGKNGTYLMPMAFPEGSPTHPSYGAGHATVAGACVTILKAFFDESFVIPNPVEASADGLSLAPYAGPPLTVGGELNKLASNVAIGRNIACVHWRSDATESLKLGEEVAIRFLREERACFNERFNGFSLTRFDGTRVTV